MRFSVKSLARETLIHDIMQVVRSMQVTPGYAAKLSGGAMGSGGGVAGMFRGAMPLFATVPMNNALLMYGYGVGKSFGSVDANHAAKTSLMPVFVGGCAGGFVQSFLQSPVELLKVRLQLAATGRQPSMSNLTLELLRSPGHAEGTAGAAGGLLPPLLSTCFSC